MVLHHPTASFVLLLATGLFSNEGFGLSSDWELHTHHNYIHSSNSSHFAFNFAHKIRNTLWCEPGFVAPTVCIRGEGRCQTTTVFWNKCYLKEFKVMKRDCSLASCLLLLSCLSGLKTVLRLLPYCSIEPPIHYNIDMLFAVKAAHISRCSHC